MHLTRRKKSIGSQQSQGAIRDTLSINLRLYRTMRGWNQAKLAEKAGIHRTYISLIECTKCNVTIDSLERIALALNLDIGDLLTAEPQLRAAGSLKDRSND